jgi:hypothetical protein
MDDTKRKGFLWGVLLACSPMLFVILTFSREISRQKTSGLGAVAGGLSEPFANFGFVAVVVSQVSAIILLVRASSEGQSPMRLLISGISICCAGFTLLICAFLIWLAFSRHLG